MLFRFIKYFLVVGVIIAVFIVLVNFMFQQSSLNFTEIKYGVSFSPRYARYLNLDWQDVYVKVLDELKVRNLRLPTYWTSLASQEKVLDFSETDFMLDEAEKRGAKVILALGLKQPRWPECHIPEWAKRLNAKDRQAEVLNFVKKTVERYKDRNVIWAWQVENEPFVSWFGENCDPLDKDFLKQEIQLVKQVDESGRPIIITDTGEWSLWRSAIKSSDILGISLYRKAYNSQFGYVGYPIPSSFYPLKSNLARGLFASKNQMTIIAELQAEPWVQKAITDTPLEEQIKLFTISDLKGNVEFAQKTGFDEIYLWGVEWWFWMSENGHPQYLEFAKSLFEI